MYRGFSPEELEKISEFYRRMIENLSMPHAGEPES